MREPGTGAVFEPLTTHREYTPAEMQERSRDFAADLARRRTVRQFSDRPVPPWHFVVVTDPGLKRRPSSSRRPI